MEKPDCYQCKHRTEAPGSAHSTCNHPAFAKVADDPLMNMMAIFGSVGRGPPMQVLSSEITVVGDKYGISQGWFNHPFNFDPIWLRECNGFEQRK